MGLAISTLCIYIAKMYRDNWKRSQDDKIRAEEKVEKDRARDQALADKVIEALTLSRLSVENNSKVVQQNMDVLNIVKYKLP